jgi:hypothetical protein
MRDRPTIGFLSTWSVYEGTTIDGYTHTLLQGICAAAGERNCNLLIGCGISLPGSPRGSRTAWAVPGAGVDFIPVGPWNCDGLIVIPDDFSVTQFQYLDDFYADYPAVTCHSFGKGSSYYLGTSLEQAGLSWSLSRVIEEAGVQDGRKLPAGVEMTIRSDGVHTWTFILNYSDERVHVEVPVDGINLVTGAVVKGSVSLGSKDVAVVQA